MLRRLLTMEGALFFRVIQRLDPDAWEDGFAFFLEHSEVDEG
jgi:hypothetical protein